MRAAGCSTRAARLLGVSLQPGVFLSGNHTAWDGNGEPNEDQRDWGGIGRSRRREPQNPQPCQLEGLKVQQGAPRLEVYKQVDVARVVGHPARDGAEHPQMAHTVATSDCRDVTTTRAKLVTAHCRRRPDARPDRRKSWWFARMSWRPSLGMCGAPPAQRHWLAPYSIHTSVSPPGWE